MNRNDCKILSEQVNRMDDMLKGKEDSAHGSYKNGNDAGDSPMILWQQFLAVLNSREASLIKNDVLKLLLYLYCLYSIYREECYEASDFKELLQSFREI